MLHKKKHDKLFTYGVFSFQNLVDELQLQVPMNSPRSLFQANLFSLGNLCFVKKLSKRTKLLEAKTFVAKAYLETSEETKISEHQNA